jgi:hypothetical protein
VFEGKGILGVAAHIEVFFPRTKGPKAKMEGTEGGEGGDNRFVFLQKMWRLEDGHNRRR